MPAPPPLFHCPPQPQVFAGAAPVLPGPAAPGGGFQAIPAMPAAPALAALCAALRAGLPFCLHGGDLPPGLGAAKGQFVTLTGGSSGRPKAILRSQQSWIRSFEINADLFNYASTESIAVLGQLSHSLALYGVLEALHLGLGAHVLCDLPPRAQRAALAQAAVPILYATPTQLRLLARSAAGAELPALRLILCGGGALDAASRAAVQALCPEARIHVFYGAAETSFITLADETSPEGTVGRPYPGVEIEIRDAAGRAGDGPGEIWVNSPYLFDHYLSGSEAGTQRRGGFVSVGELGTRDARGHLTILGRKSRMVTIADQNVFLEEVETWLQGQWPQAGCAVLAQPDPLRGAQLIAVLEGAAPAPDAERALLARARADLGPLKAPRALRFLPGLPLLGSGKVDLMALAQMLGEDP